MRILHTSDWHLGRSLHRHDLIEAQAAFLDHVVEVAYRERIDAVLVAGDVYDRALPTVEAMRLLADVLARLRDLGVAVIAISGNHDAPSRLGDRAVLLDRRIQIRTDPAAVARPVLLTDRHGEVAFYPIPYLEPAAVRTVLPGADEPTDGVQRPFEGGAHQRVMRRALAAISADRAARGVRSVAIAHAWITGGDASDSERDITVGGLAHVPAGEFDGIDYVALGHLHKPQAITDRVRYSGSPLAYSFSEAGVAKLSWLVELAGNGSVTVEAVPAPVRRSLSAVHGRLEEVLTSSRFAEQEADFVAVTLTDPIRPADAMSTVQRRFPYALTLEFAPEGLSEDARGYAERTRGRTDLQVAEAFLAHVRTEAAPHEVATLRRGLELARIAEDQSEAVA